MTDEEWFKEQKAKTIFVVWPCSAYEELCLYQHVTQQGRSYEQGGVVQTVEYSHSMYANISYETIDDRVVAFVSGSARFDYEKMEHFLEKEFFAHIPKYDCGTRSPFTNPMNFHHCLAAIDETNSKSLADRWLLDDAIAEFDE